MKRISIALSLLATFLLPLQSMWFTKHLERRSESFQLTILRRSPRNANSAVMRKAAIR